MDSAAAVPDIGSDGGGVLDTSSLPHATGSVIVQGTGRIASSETSSGGAHAMPALPVRVHSKKKGQDLARVPDLLLQIV